MHKRHSTQLYEQRDLSDWLGREVQNLAKNQNGSIQSMRSGLEAAEVFRSCGITEDTVKSLTTLLGKAVKLAEDPPAGQIPPPAKALVVLKSVLAMVCADVGMYG